MRNFNLNRMVPAIVVVLVAGLLFGCGESRRNDQGTSFTFAGWYKTPGKDNTFEEAVGYTALVAPLSDANPESVEGGDNAVNALAALQNNLTNQTIRAERVYHSYYIPGATIQPPDTSTSIAATLGPASNNAGGGEEEEDDDSGLPFGADTTLPGNLTNVPDLVFAGAAVVTADIRTFVNTNRMHMPEPPFVMEVVSYISGVSSSGYRYETNKMQIEVIWTPDNIIPPAEGGSDDEEEEAVEEEESEVAVEEE